MSMIVQAAAHVAHLHQAGVLSLNCFPACIEVSSDPGRQEPTGIGEQPCGCAKGRGGESGCIFKDAMETAA